MAGTSNRHGFVGKMVQDAIDDLYDEPYYDEEPDEWAAWEGMDDALIDELFIKVYDVVGEEFTESQVRVALEQGSFDPELAVEYLFNPPEPVQSKKKSDNKSKNKPKKKASQGPNSNKDKKDKAAGNKNKQPTPVAKRDSDSDKFQPLNSPLAFGDDENYRIEIKRKNSSNSIDALKRKLSDADMRIPKKATKRVPEMFDDLIYGNEPYPEIEYHLEESEILEREDHINVVVCGHVDSGKSTFLGHLLVLLKAVDSQQLQKLERHLEKSTRKGANVFTWIFDEREDEREVGKTQDVNEKYLALGDKVITLLDTPGHRDLVPVMISGASHCDYGMLMVEAERSCFATGFDYGGQTKEHAKLLNSIGLNGLLVIVNKMDMVEWREADFAYVKDKMSKFFAEEGLDNLGEITFIPLSAATGENIVKPIGGKAAWWKGKPLVEYMKSFKSNIRQKISKPARMSVDSCYDCNVQAKKGKVLAGRVEGGVIKKGEKLIVRSINLEVAVKDIHVGDRPVPMAFPGDICDVLVNLKKEKDWSLVHKGCFLSSIKLQVPTAHIFLAEIKLYDLKDPVLKGTRVNMHLCGFVEGGIFSKLHKVFDTVTREVTKQNPRFLTSSQSAEVEITTDREICAEIFTNFSSLGRFQFRDKGRSLGDGRILRILK